MIIFFSISIPFEVFAVIPQICRISTLIKTTSSDDYKITEYLKVAECLGVLITVGIGQPAKILTAAHCSPQKVRDDLRLSLSLKAAADREYWNNLFKTGEWVSEIKCGSGNLQFSTKVALDKIEIHPTYENHVEAMLVRMLSMSDLPPFPIDLAVVNSDQISDIPGLGLTTKVPSEIVNEKECILVQLDSNNQIIVSSGPELVLDKEEPVFISKKKLNPGDSGGPLLCHQEKGEYTIFGINSFIIPMEGGATSLIQAFSAPVLQWLNKK
ncbi:MAG: S1 family peptidase [Bdellovibrionales bacterium]|nr:S1 family peptidase [Bdellovibrionales bacterium]